MPRRNSGCRWRVNSNSTHISFQNDLHWTQLRGNENLKIPLLPENIHRCDREVCYNVLYLPHVVHELPIRCKIRISGIFVLSERLVRKFYGTQRPQSAPSLFIPPWPERQNSRESIHTSVRIIIIENQILLNSNQIIIIPFKINSVYFWVK